MSIVIIFIAIIIFIIITAAVVALYIIAPASYELKIVGNLLVESGSFSPRRNIDINSIKVINYRPYGAYGTDRMINFEGTFNFKEPFPSHPINSKIIDEILKINSSIKVEPKYKLAEPYTSSPLYNFSVLSPITKFFIYVMIIVITIFTLWMFVGMLFK